MNYSVVTLSESILLVVILWELSQSTAISQLCGYANIVLSVVIIVGDLLTSFVSWNVISCVGNSILVAAVSRFCIAASMDSIDVLIYY